MSGKGENILSLTNGKWNVPAQYEKMLRCYSEEYKEYKFGLVIPLLSFKLGTLMRPTSNWAHIVTNKNDFQSFIR